MNEEPAARRPSRMPRAVPASHALAWFAEAMRLWKLGPMVFGAISIVVLVFSLAFDAVPIAGALSDNLLVPLVSCGLIYACLAADRDGRPRIMQLLAVFAAPLSAQFAVLLAGFLVTGAENFVAWQMAGVNLFLPLDNREALSASAIVATYATGLVVSLPVTFVPMAALFDGEGIADAFALSMRAFALNVPGLLAFAAYSLVLLLLGLVTYGVGLVLALPWIAAASYAAWKDIFALSGDRSTT